MLRRARAKFPAAEIEANLTPMIDVSFLLIVFFALVSRITDTERSRMTLAEVGAGAAVKPEEEARMVLNVVPGADGAAAGYRLSGVDFEPTPEGVAGVAEMLAEGYRINPRLAVNLRADAATRYEFVEPAMRAATTAARLAGGGALPRLNLIVTEDPAAGGATDAR